jgi:hypothetical protein
VKRSWDRSRFDDPGEDPQASLVNLVDIMLVFICGLIVALVSAQPQIAGRIQEAAGGGRVVEQGRELAELPEGLQGQAQGGGMEPVGQVFRDPNTGKLILVGQ